jgi:hypothetical protein
MFFKIIAAAAIMAVPAVAHAQGTTPTVPQDTTHTRIRTDSTKVDTANGSIYTKKKTTVTDTTKATRTRSDSTMNIAPLDTTRVPSTRPAKTPPR